MQDKLKKIDGVEWKWLDDGCVRVTSEPVPALRLVADHENNYVYQVMLILGLLFFTMMT